MLSNQIIQSRSTTVKSTPRSVSRIFVTLGATLLIGGSVAGLATPRARAQDRDLSALRLQHEQRRNLNHLVSQSATKTSENKKEAPPYFDDADDDGMADLWEQTHGLDPHDPDDAWLDPDADSVINLFEFQLDADPNDGESPQIATVAHSGAMFTDVAVAIQSVQPGTCIRIAEGVYNVNYLSFQPIGVMLQGGWSGDFSARDIRQFTTTLDGRNRDEVLYFSPGFGESAIVLDGLKIIRGKGVFGAVNFLASGTARMKTSVVDCSIVDSGQAWEFGGVLEMHNWDSSISDRTLASSLVGGNSANGIYSQITEGSNANWRIINTTISGNWNGGGDNGFGLEAFTLGDSFLSVHLFNSIVWGNDEAKKDIDLFGDIVIEADHADIGEVQVGFGARLNAGAHVVNVDPGFVNPSESNFRLTRYSDPLVVDAGTNVGIPPTDLDGNQRTFGAGVDIGAYEAIGIQILEPTPGIVRQMNQFEVQHATPRSRVFFLYGFRHGTYVVPGCHGVTMDIESPSVFGSALADELGTASISFFVPKRAKLRPKLFQAVDTRCQVSDLIVFQFE